MSHTPTSVPGTPKRRLSMPKLTRRLTNIVIHVDEDNAKDVEPVTTTSVPTRSSRREPLSEEHTKQWRKCIPKPKNDVDSIQEDIVHHTLNTVCRGVYNLDKLAVYQATAYSVRDRLVEEWNLTQEGLHKSSPKRCYYLSMEFLIGRALDNALNSLHVSDKYKESVQGLGFRLEDLLEQENDAALGNGGLGRLAACYMDSAATLEYPTWGYGLRYQYGIFKQIINDGYQNEIPDYWLKFENPWEFPRTDILYDVQFYGYVATKMNDKGESRLSWEGGEKVQAMAYDVPIPGFATKSCGNIRLWQSKPKNSFDFASFNEGDYDKSVREQKNAENLTSVLYPNDNHLVGKELRLKQEYFFVSASLQDIIYRFKRFKLPWSEFPNQVAIQLNDTHPTLGIPELQRLLVDVEGLTWDDAWEIVQKTFAFTNHTVLPEALERWSVPMMEHVLPRHMQIIYDINLFFLQRVEQMYFGDRELLNRISIIEESNPQHVRMAYLAVVGSHTVNGVAALHSDLIKKELFSDFIKYYGPEKFINITNGITPRRWLYQANPSLRNLITETLKSEEWVTKLDLLQGLKKYADDADFQKRWMDVKHKNKERLAKWIQKNMDITVSPDALFDIQVKRIHEYKRQYMNILGVIYRYLQFRRMDSEELDKQIPRVVIFGGKAAPGYYIAKLVIKLINSVADVVNNDVSIKDKLKVVFIPDYNVSLAEIIIPASDLSQHISTAGTEASGTSNMKFVLNGGLIIGTVDGANIEIRDEIGEENIFMFGTLADEVADIRHNQKFYGVLVDSYLQQVIDAMESGMFGDPSIFNPLINTLTYGGDYYLVSADFESYLKTQEKVDACFADTQAWARKSIMCTAGMGYFSADRAVREYADKIWNIKPFPVEKFEKKED
ncbi:glycosyl transferase [Radiomyces spectabilis]|uniref:glycosyl transferase n=1 Tax=Radiomyces spectabilis TaxID=64574 RepID=UPI00221F8A57|nr:glycosyl transferase [Radiomyces spectabilis]KAI8391314.1 glycosyl transferase [Radiomyces spectabilis]